MISEKGDSWKFPNDSITLKAERKEIWVRYICIHSPCDSGHLPFCSLLSKLGRGWIILICSRLCGCSARSPWIPLTFSDHPAPSFLSFPGTSFTRTTWEHLRHFGETVLGYLPPLPRERESSRASVFIHPLGTLSQWLMIRENKILAQ